MDEDQAATYAEEDDDEGANNEMKEMKMEKEAGGKATQGLANILLCG